MRQCPMPELINTEIKLRCCCCCHDDMTIAKKTNTADENVKKHNARFTAT